MKYMSAIYVFFFSNGKLDIMNVRLFADKQTVISTDRITIVAIILQLELMPGLIIYQLVIL